MGNTPIWIDITLASIAMSGALFLSALTSPQSLTKIRQEAEIEKANLAAVYRTGLFYEVFLDSSKSSGFCNGQVQDVFHFSGTLKIGGKKGGYLCGDKVILSP